ncbi:ATP-grasp domain-containing protein [Catellatospora paridis]|uniref:ATP-grasp domain-containing protein n=1 Tax=Catellatospora paridis TaxID=1617086 RepID=UPI0012D3C4C4|nr:ATP-grasp domain-containing protein [Catellatospora paridis]
MSNVLVLSNHNSLLEDALVDAGHDVYVAMTKANAARRAAAGRLRYEILTVSDWQSLTELQTLARQLRHDIGYVATCWEGAMVAAGLLRDLLGLPGQTTAQAVAFTDKAVMKRKLAAAGVPVVRHQLVRSIQHVAEAAIAVGRWPVILKPLSGFASTNTHVLRGTKDIAEAMRAGVFTTGQPTSDAFASERAFHGLEHQGGFLVEQYLQVEVEYHADALWQNGTTEYHVVGRYSTPPLSGMGKTLGSWLLDPDSREAARVVELAEAAARALGMTTGFTHTEIMRSDGDWYVGEIAARVGGGGIQACIGNAHGLDVPSIMAQIACEQPVDVTLENRPGVFGWAGVAVPEGRVTGVATREQVRAHPAVIDASVAATAGMYGGPTSTGLWAGLAGVAQLCTDDVEAMTAAIDDIAGLYAVTVDPTDTP